MIYFKDLALKEEIKRALETIEFVSPTPIQEQTIPYILENKQDLIALAQTGTGKTAGFGLPVINMIDENSKDVQAFILCPTRELCLQIAKDLDKFSKFIRGINVVAVYGGASVPNQLRELKRGANIVVGTPGRVNDFIQRKSLDVSKVKWLVLDEADEMLNMGFKEELDQILANTPSEKQTLLFSATMPREIQRIANEYMKEPHEITTGSKNMGADTVAHHIYTVRSKDRYAALKRIADMNPNIYSIVFCRTRRETQEIAEKLQFDGYNADSLHGELSQSIRETVMNKFRNRHIQLLVATDVAARGLDINDLTHVINYGLPDEADTYVHRSGRTGRAGKSGICISITHTKEGRKLKQIERRLQKNLEHKEVPSGREICEKQLFNLIDTVQKVEVNDEEINPFMEVIFKKLSWLEREDLIKHFVAVEFNKFLEYYKGANDINYHRESRSRRDDDRDSRGRDSRRDGRRDRNRDDRPRDNREEGRREPRKVRAQQGYTRFFMNVGTEQSLSKPKLIGIINDLNLAPRIDIGKIDLKGNFSFFEIESKYETAILKKFKRGVRFNQNRVRIEIAK